MKTIIFTPAVAKQLDALPRDIAETIVEALCGYAIEGLGDVKKLKDRDGLRLRVGRYRVIFREATFEILAIYVGKRETTTYR